MVENLEIQEFFVEGNDQGSSHVLLHIAEPVTAEEIERGWFFALVEINESYPEQISQLQQIIDDIESNYYETEEFTPDLFEKILQQINRQSHNVLQYAGTEINCLVGTLQKQRLVLAYHGDPQAILYYLSKDELKETPIIEEDTTSSEQLFSAVIEGNINAGDHVYLASPHVETYLSSDRIKKIIQARTTRQSAQHIQKILESLNHKYSFGGVIFHLPKTGTALAPGGKTKETADGSQASMENFLQTARSTEETLSPPLLKNIKKGLSTALTNFQKQKKTPREKNIAKRNKARKTKRSSLETNYRPSLGSKETFANRLLIGLGRTLVFIGTGLYLIGKKLLHFTVTASQYIFFFISNKNGQRTVIIDKWQNYLENKKQDITSLSLMNKAIFVALITLVIIFLSSIAYLKIQESRAATLAQYNSLVESILDKKDEAEAHLLYGEETQALDLLQTAQNMLAVLPQKSKQKKAKAEELHQAIEDILVRLRKITIVEPELIVDLTASNPEANTTDAVLLADKLVIFGPQDSSLYFIDPVIKSIETKKHETIPNLNSADVPKENDKITFVASRNGLAEYDKETNTLSSENISYPSNDPEIKDVFIYNRRAYTLDPANEQIYKHNTTQTGYDRGTQWIKNKSDSLQDAIALAIDGDLFVLTKAGKILKFYAGEQQTFEINGLDPLLDNPVDLWTYSDVNNLYILEPTNKRVVIIDKEGNFIGQYTSDVWQEPSSLIVKENEKTIFVLDNNKVYKFNF